MVLVEDKTSNWVEYLTFVEFAYRTYDLSGFGKSPYQIMFGRDPRLPIDLYADEDENWNSRVDRVKYSTLHSERVNIIRGMVREIQSLSNSQNTTRYDSKH